MSSSSERRSSARRTCTSYKSMCSLCKCHFNALLDKLVPPEDLVYKRDTYPLVFEHHITIEGSFTVESAKPLGTSRLLNSLSDRLDERFRTPPILYGHFRTSIEGGKAMHLFLSVLIDFPRKVVPYKEFMDWLFDGLAVAVRGGRGRRTRDRSGRGRGREGLPKEITPLVEWEVFTPNDEDHLCEARLNWFMMRHDLRHLLGIPQ